MTHETLSPDLFNLRHNPTRIQSPSHFHPFPQPPLHLFGVSSAQSSPGFSAEYYATSPSEFTALDADLDVASHVGAFPNASASSTSLCKSVNLGASHPGKTEP